MGKIIHRSVSGIIMTPTHFFMGKRSTDQRYFPGFWSFPGGKISREDEGEGREVELNALARELFEELDWNITNEKITYLQTIITPEFSSYRFENSFYLIEINKEKEFQLNSEFSEGKWVSFAEKDQFFTKKNCLTIPAFSYLLKRVQQKKTCQYEHSFLEKKGQQISFARYLPFVTHYFVPSYTLPPSQHTNMLLIGKSKKILVDPSPKNMSDFQLLVQEFNKNKLEFIFISHNHPDHYQRVSCLAESLQLPIKLSKKVYEKILRQEGESYFEKCDISFLKEGDMIDLREIKLRVKAHEGHCQGQLGLEEENQAWVFVSDIFQGIGSVVVENMDLYLKTLETLINYPCHTIFIPSHGLPVGGKGVLRKIYHHRQQREKDIARLYKQGMSESEILEKLYPYLSAKMKGYALTNIRGHLQRIKNSIL